MALGAAVPIMASVATPPIPLPEVLLDEPPTVKLLYVWLVHNGEVDMSQRRIGEALGITQANVSIAANRLVELGLVRRGPGARARVRAGLRVAPSSTRSRPN